MKHPRTELEAWLAPSRTETELTERCTATHPNHEFLSPPINDERQFWQAWCSKCSYEGKSGRPCDKPNPDMTFDHLVDYDRFWGVANGTLEDAPNW